MMMMMMTENDAVVVNDMSNDMSYCWDYTRKTARAIYRTRNLTVRHY